MDGHDCDIDVECNVLDVFSHHECDVGCDAMNLRDDIELTALTETGRLDIAEDVGLIFQYCWDMMLWAIGVEDRND